MVYVGLLVDQVHYTRDQFKRNTAMRWLAALGNVYFSMELSFLV